MTTADWHVTRAWRRANPEKWNEMKKRNYAKGRRFARGNYRPWLETEIELIFDMSYRDIDLAKKLKRSVQAIQIKRCRINQHA